MTVQRERGFTLIEIMITIAVVGILTAIALPNYSAYILRSRVPVGLDALSSTATRLEQYYQDVGNYGAASCGQGLAMPTPANYTVTCTLNTAGQGFLLTATGTASLVGVTYTINQRGARSTPSHPHGSNATCWTIKGTVCDA
jgi:type IV pilus assembly protein PilE